MCEFQIDRVNGYGVSTHGQKLNLCTFEPCLPISIFFYSLQSYVGHTLLLLNVFFYLLC